MSHHKVSNVMSTDVTTVREDTPFKDVVRAPAHRDVSALPVVDTDGKLPEAMTIDITQPPRVR